MSIFKKIDTLQKVPCEKCNFCFKMRLVEMGFISEEKIEVTDYKFGLWTVNVLSEIGEKISTFAIRKEEMDNTCIL